MQYLGTLIFLLIADAISLVKGEHFSPSQLNKLLAASSMKNLRVLSAHPNAETKNWNNININISDSISDSHNMLPITVATIPRGGAVAIDIDMDDDDEESSVLMKKVRNVIRSFLAVGENKIPLIASLTRNILGCMESITGIPLLPSESKPLKRSTRKKARGRKKGKSRNINESNPRASSSPNGNPTKSEQKANGKVRQASNKIKTNASTTGQSAAAQSHLSKELKTSNPNYRIQRELKEFLKSPPPNLTVKVGKNIRVWIINMVGTKGSLYEGETYRLRVQFPTNYPTQPPSVYFLQPSPRHEHVYTNGDICLSLLGKDWRPNMTAQSIAMSILSILCGAGRKSLPMDNAAHAQSKPGQKQDDWVYHDDNC